MKSIRIDRPHTLHALLIGALISIGAAATFAGPAEADTVRWQTAGIWGADVRSLAVHPHDPDVVVAGTSSGQVYLSTDGGEQWRDAGQYLPFPGWVVSDLVFDPNRPGGPAAPPRLWAGLRGVWGDGLVSVSDDLGKSWEPREGDLPDVSVYALALVPGREGKIYLGTRDGVWATSDGGARWRKVTRGIEEMGKVTSLWVPDGEPDTVIAGTWRRAYKSDDGGATWRGVFEGMFLDSEVFTLVPTKQSGEVWASTCNWVYQSLDGGESWRRFVAGMDERRATTFAALPWGRLLTGTVAGLYASDDQGRNWKLASGEGLSIHTIAHHPGKNRLFLGTDGGGVWISSDGGDTLRPSSVGMTNLRVGDVAAAGEELLVAVNHAGPGTGIYVSRDGGRTFPDRTTGMPTVLDLAVGPGSSPGEARVWAATERGLFERRGGQWSRVEAFGERRVEEVLARDGRVVVRAPDGVWELEKAANPAEAGKEAFVETPYTHGTPRSAALRGGELWVTDAAGLYRVAEGSNHTVAAPFAPGRLAVLGERLLYAGAEGTWMRGELADPWRPLGAAAARVVDTGDARLPVLLVEGEEVRLLDSRGEAAFDVSLPIPARFVAGALVYDGRLFVATSGFGLLSKDLATDEPAIEAP